MDHYLHGIDCVGGATGFDNHATYYPGDVVYFSQKNWRAMRRVDPPLIPAMQDGEVPGISDAWREAPQDVLGGGFDLSSWATAFKNLGGKKDVPATLPPSAVFEKHAQASAGTAALYTGIGVIGVAVVGLSGYLLLRKRKK